MPTQTTQSNPKVAMNSLNICDPPSLTWRETLKTGSPNIRCAAATPANAPAT